VPKEGWYKGEKMWASNSELVSFLEKKFKTCLEKIKFIKLEINTRQYIDYFLIDF